MPTLSTFFIQDLFPTELCSPATEISVGFSHFHCNDICLTLSFLEVRQILVDQLKSFDNKTEGKVLFLADLQEFFRRLSEIELEYSRNLERLSRMYLDKLQRHKSQR